MEVLIENVNHVFCSVEVVLEIMKAFAYEVPVAKYFLLPISGFMMYEFSLLFFSSSK